MGGGVPYSMHLFIGMRSGIFKISFPVAVRYKASSSKSSTIKGAEERRTGRREGKNVFGTDKS